FVLEHGFSVADKVVPLIRGFENKKPPTRVATALQNARRDLISDFAGSVRRWTPISWPEGLQITKQSACQFHQPIDFMIFHGNQAAFPSLRLGRRPCIAEVIFCALRIKAATLTGSSAIGYRTSCARPD